MQQLQQSEQSYFSLFFVDSLKYVGAISFIHLVFLLLTVDIVKTYDNLELNIHDTFLYEMS